MVKHGSNQTIYMQKTVVALELLSLLAVTGLDTPVPVPQFTEKTLLSDAEVLSTVNIPETLVAKAEIATIISVAEVGVEAVTTATAEVVDIAVIGLLALLDRTAGMLDRCHQARSSLNSTTPSSPTKFVFTVVPFSLVEFHHPNKNSDSSLKPRRSSLALSTLRRDMLSSR